jgi:hypothetical protein
VDIIDATPRDIIFGSRPDGDLMDAARQYASRPLEDRCLTVEAMVRRTEERYASSREGYPTDPATLRVEATDKGLLLFGSRGTPAAMSHLGFGQLAQKVGAPASYLRELSPSTAALALNEGLRTRGASLSASELVPLWSLTRGSDGQAFATLRSLQTTKYARVWDRALARKLESFIERNAGWGPAEAFRKANGDASFKGWGEKKDLPLAFVGEEGFFAFCVNYDRPVDIGGTTLVPGFFLRNSETGTGAIEAVFFFLDFVCCNMIVWGAKNVRTVKIRHVGDAERRALDDYGDVQNELRAQAEGSSLDKVESIRRAQRVLVANTKEDVIDKLFRGFDVSKRTVEAAYEVAEQTPRYGDPRSVWGIVNGLTEVSQKESYGSDRVAADRVAGKVLEKFAF